MAVLQNTSVTGTLNISGALTATSISASNFLGLPAAALSAVISANLGAVGTNTRQLANTYQNTTGRTLFLSVGVASSGSNSAYAYVGSDFTSVNNETIVPVANATFPSYISGIDLQTFVPPGHYYRVSGQAGVYAVNLWYEYELVGGGGDVVQGANNTFTAVNTFNNNFITASVGITGSTAQFTAVSASNLLINGNTLTTNVSTFNLLNSPTSINAFESASNISFGSINNVNTTFRITGSANASISLHSFDNSITDGEELGRYSVVGPIANTSSVQGTRSTISTVRDGTGGQAKIQFNLGQNNSASTRVGVLTLSNFGCLVRDGLIIGSTVGTVTQGSGDLIVSGAITGSRQLISGDLRVLGTASIGQLNTVNQTSLVVGDKYITILSGGVDHTGINGAGFLWGTSSGPGETTGALGEHAHILYDASRDALKIFPGLYVTGNTTIDGNVGIGTNNPSNKLHVKSSGEIAALETTSATGSNYLRFKNETNNLGYFGWGSAGNNHLNFSNEAVGDITFLAGGSERLRISGSNGNVGIGTTSPQQALDVVGSMRLSTGDIYRPDNTGIALEVGNGTNTHYGNHIFKDGVGTNERMRITDGGNVGIGTTSPATKLDVNGIISIGGKPVINTTGNGANDIYGNFRVLSNDSTVNQDGMYIGYNSTGGVNAHIRFYASGSTERMRIDASNGYVGIGTSSPNYKLHVATTSGAALALDNPSTTGNTFFYFNNGAVTLGGIGYFSTNKNLSIYNQENGDIIFATDSTERLRISGSNGNVGIGTNSPVTKLDVSGSIRVAGGSIYGQVSEITSSTSTNYTLQTSDSGKLLTINNASFVTASVPSGLPTGFTVSICQLGTGQIVVTGSVGVTINNRQNHKITAGQYAVVSLISTAANTYILAGDTTI